MISIPAVLTYLKGSKAYITLLWTFLFHLTINETQLKTNNDSTDLTENIPWTTQHTPSSTVTNWLWSLMHLEKSISRGFEMDSPKFSSWPMTCCDGCFLGPCWRWWLCWLQTVALRSLLSAVQADNAQFQLVSEVSKWNGGQCQSTGSKQDNHIQTGAACSSQLISCWSFTHLFEKNMSHVLPTKGTYIFHSQAFFPYWGKEKVYKVHKVPKNP